MTTCKDPNDPTQNNLNSINQSLTSSGLSVNTSGAFTGVASQGTITSVSALNTYTASDGTLLPSFTATAIEEYSRIVSSDLAGSETNNIINKYKTQYGEEVFNTGLVSLNTTLVNREIFQNNLPNYPELQNRLNTQLPITPIEYASYMNEFLQTPITLTNLVNTNPTLVQSQLNDFYKNNFTQSAIGSFCALMPSVFGAIGSFFNLVEDAKQKFQDITDFINNFSLKDFSLKAIMKKLIGQIKEQILKIVDNMVSKVKGIIENLSFESVIGQIETIVNERIIGRFISLKARALSFFSEENIGNLKKKIENLINYAGSVFKNPSLEEIQFLVYRFCSFASQIENAINLLKKPLDDFFNDYQNTFQSLKSLGRVLTSRAVLDGGAIRYSEEERKTRINNGYTIEQDQSPELPNDLTISELAEAQAINTYEAVKADPRFDVSGLSKNNWEMIFIKGTRGTVVARLIRLQRLFAEKTGITKLKIVSAYRSPESQREIWVRQRADQIGGNRVGAERAAAEELDSIIKNGLRNPLSGSVALPGGSKHQSGKAFDINWSGYNRETIEIFCILAKNKCGFNGFGIYSVTGGIVHIDTQSNTVWGGAANQINFNRAI